MKNVTYESEGLVSTSCYWKKGGEYSPNPSYIMLRENNWKPSMMHPQHHGFSKQPPASALRTISLKPSPRKNYTSNTDLSGDRLSSCISFNSSFSQSSSTSSLSQEADDYTRLNTNPRALFVSHWTKNFPERVESFSEDPFPLRVSITRRDEFDMRAKKHNNILRIDDKIRDEIYSLTRTKGATTLRLDQYQKQTNLEEPYTSERLKCASSSPKKRSIFGHDSYYMTNNRLKTTNSDTVLHAYKDSPSKPVLNKAKSASALIRNKKSRDKNLNVSFHPRIADIIEYPAAIEFYAREDWSKYYC